jgi:putative heme transporter
VIGIALAGLALWALNGQRGELTGATSELSHLHTQWLAVAVGVELISLYAFAAMERLLLGRAGVNLGRARVLGITLGAGAIANSIPAGPAVSSVFSYRQFRRAGADEAIAAWTLIATLTCASLGLMLVSTAGVLIAERQGASLDLIGVTVGVFVVVIVLAVIVWQRVVAVAVASAVLRLCQRLTGRPRGEAAETVRMVLRHLKAVHLDFWDLAGALGWSLANWGFDCGCLICCFLVVGAAVPWRGMLLAYGAAQLASNLPITPGGLGVVEGSLTIALVYYGGLEVSTVAAVVLYRLISFWGYLPVGWLAWGGITYRNRMADRRDAARLSVADEAALGGPSAVAEDLTDTLKGGS